MSDNELYKQHIQRLQDRSTKLVRYRANLKKFYDGIAMQLTVYPKTSQIIFVDFQQKKVTGFIKHENS